MRFRRHHNNKGYRQIKNGSTRKQVERIAKKVFKEIQKTGKCLESFQKFE